ADVAVLVRVLVLVVVLMGAVGRHRGDLGHDTLLASSVSQSATPSGPSHTTSATSVNAGCSCDEDTTAQQAIPRSRSRGSNSNAGKSPRSSPTIATRPGD